MLPVAGKVNAPLGGRGVLACPTQLLKALLNSPVGFIPTGTVLKALLHPLCHFSHQRDASHSPQHPRLKRRVTSSVDKALYNAMRWEVDKWTLITAWVFVVAGAAKAV